MNARMLALASTLTLAALSGAAAQTPAPAPGVPSSADPSATVTPPVSPASPPAASTTGTTGTVTTLGSAVRQLTVDALEDMDFVGADGKEIGDIERVVESNADKKQFVVIERGGFLGFGVKAIAVPVENVAVQGDKVILREMDLARLDAMPAYVNENNAYRDLDDAQQVSLAQQ